MAYKNSRQKYCRWMGAASLLSCIAYAAGLPTWWMPVTVWEPVRATILVVIHFAGLVIGISSFDDSLWEEKQ